MIYSFFVCVTRHTGSLKYSIKGLGYNKRPQNLYFIVSPKYEQIHRLLHKSVLQCKGGRLAFLFSNFSVLVGVAIVKSTRNSSITFKLSTCSLMSLPTTCSKYCFLMLINCQQLVELVYLQGPHKRFSCCKTKVTIQHILSPSLVHLT